MRTHLVPEPIDLQVHPSKTRWSRRADSDISGHSSRVQERRQVTDPRKAVVTGGAGFIGSHLVERLVNDGLDVVVIDNMASGRLKNLHHLRNSSHLSVHQLDLANYDNVSPILEGVDWVFHLGALADIVPSIENPIAYHEANVNGTVVILEAARSADVDRFVYAASSSCYGLPDTFPTPETAPIRPMYPYALTKYLGEQYVMHWANVYGMKAVSLRLFNVYGPRARTSGTYGAVFGVFLAQMLAGKPLTIVGDGSQTRDFTYVTDVIDAFVRAADSNVNRQVFNVGSGGTYSINRLAELLGGESVRLPKRPGEPDCTFADIESIKNSLGWRPQISFEEGVAKMLDHIEDWADARVWDKESIAVATAGWFEYLQTSPSPQ
ncbi:MAG TPA: SDR family oxidoreductase [Alphaproteobacteria bacterium]|nr:SDR family oxidoreductase [Alphaproteobacteria bacterium]